MDQLAGNGWCLWNGSREDLMQSIHRYLMLVEPVQMEMEVCVDNTETFYCLGNPVECLVYHNWFGSSSTPMDMWHRIWWTELTVTEDWVDVAVGSHHATELSAILGGCRGTLPLRWTAAPQYTGHSVVSDTSECWVPTDVSQCTGPSTERGKARRSGGCRPLAGPTVGSQTDVVYVAARRMELHHPEYRHRRCTSQAEGDGVRPRGLGVCPPSTQLYHQPVYHGCRHVGFDIVRRRVRPFRLPSLADPPRRWRVASVGGPESPAGV
jgi:hypothetical protein